MADYSQIVVGAGSSGLTYLYCALQTGDAGKKLSGTTLVIGERDLWMKNNPAHKMGQPEDILYPLASRRKKSILRRKSIAAEPREGLPFLQAGKYVGGEEAMKKTIQKLGEEQQSPVEFEQGRVTRVSGAGPYSVSVTYSDGSGSETLTADKVIIACGPGPAASLADRRVKLVNEAELKNHRRPFPELISGEDYYWQYSGDRAQRFQIDVCVFGSSATSSWDVGSAIACQARSILWLARSDFSQANPVGRNDDIILYALNKGMMFLGDVEDITILNNVTDVEEPRIRVRFKQPTITGQAPQPPLTKPGTGEVQVLDIQEKMFHQFVYALGANPKGDMGPANILEDGLRQTLKPMYDSDKRFTLDSDNTVIALSNDNGSLLVVGAALFRNLALTDFDRALGDKITSGYQKVPDMFCKATKPPEGIFVIKASIKAATGFVEPISKDEFNWKTADRLELQEFLAAAYGDDWGSLGVMRQTTLISAVMNRQKETDTGFSKDEFVDVLKQETANLGVGLGSPFDGKLKKAMKKILASIKAKVRDLRGGYDRL